MCTAVFSKGKHRLLGRTLDLDCSYGESVVLAPRAFAWRFRHLEGSGGGYAMLGVAHVEAGVPLYYDAVNEKGLAMAALNFPRSAVYRTPARGRLNLASFELLPWLLSRFASVSEAERYLARLNVTDDAFSASLPPSPLHWILADRERAITVEAVLEGVRVYANPVGVLTNEPPFPYQMLRLADCMQAGAASPENRICGDVPLPHYSGGMGGIGLPGDLSSTSRFVRAVFAEHHTDRAGEEITRLFHVMDTVALPSGCAWNLAGRPQKTVYTAVLDLSGGSYYFTTYEDRRIRTVCFDENDPDSDCLSVFSMEGGEELRTLSPIS